MPKADAGFGCAGNLPRVDAEQHRGGAGR